MTRIADMTSPEITDAAGPTDEDFRAIGFTKEASNWPRDELAVKMIAAFNGVPADDLPSLAWRYFPNKQTADAWKRVADVALAAGRAEAVAAPAAPSEAQDDEDRCIACDKPFKPGDMVLNDVSGGSIHIECCGPDRESYVGPGDPFPKGYAWQPAPAAEAEPAPVAWPSGFFAIGGDARLRDCATEGCGQHVSIRVERDGTGSEHCEPCARKIAAALAQSDAAGGE